MTAAYGVSLATAAAELASVEALQPKLAALVAQLQAQLLQQQDRVGATATRLAADPRTAGAAAVLAAVGPRTGADLVPSAVRIADAAAAVTTRLVAVAETRAAQGREDDDEVTAPRRPPSAKANSRPVATTHPAGELTAADIAVARLDELQPATLAAWFAG